MGICLDTEREHNGSQEFEEHGREVWLSDNAGNFRYVSTPPEGQFPMQNGGHVKFEAPKVPVIFVLGGPGSGKVTHCDNLMLEKRGITHINMTDLLQQYTIGNEMKDFSQLSSKTVTEVLMLEMKMSPAAKTYLVSGYPRNMRDVVEYSNKIQIVNGVVLVAWRQKVLERQIDYGAKLGHVVLSLARMELVNFYKNVMPVADYFDQRGMLIAVNGERNPSEVYKDFRTAVLRILGMQESLPNGDVVKAGPTTVVSVYLPPPKTYPPVIWIIGGPGSNKALLCQNASRDAPGWIHLSIGRLLRAAVESPGKDNEVTKQAISAGEMVAENVVLDMVDTQMSANMNAQGILMDGFPKDMSQVLHFEDKFKQHPKIVLLDCSKLQLGRGRLDDSVAAFRRRLELFRQLSLPMLKALDSENRLIIVDGDSDSPAIQEEFSRAILQLVEESGRAEEELSLPNGTIPNQVATDTLLQDLEEEENHQLPNGYAVSTISGTVAAYQQHAMANGGLFGGPMLMDDPSTKPNAQVDRYHNNMDSNM